MRNLPIVLLFISLSSFADVKINVIDVGPGLCTITEMPGNHYMIYDAGHWNGRKCIQAVRDIVDGEEIDLLIISHSDSDHLGDADDILNEYDVSNIIRTGFDRWDTSNWKNFNEAVGKEAMYGATVINLATLPLIPGDAYDFGDATVTLIAGWSEWEGPEHLSTSELRNVISIVVRLDYKGQTILFGGDSVGRESGDHVNTCIAAEKGIVDNKDEVSLKSDVIIAPHHGADNGSSKCFIEAVDPTYVIFSAGHDYEHPRAVTAQRYIDHGVPVENIFRTDRGDDEGGKEWSEDSVTNCVDGRGDDDIEIILKEDGATSVKYLNQSSNC